MEMGDTPILDHGAYVMLGNDELFLQMLAEGQDFERIRDYMAWTMRATKAMGVKVVNPAASRPSSSTSASSTSTRTTSTGR